MAITELDRGLGTEKLNPLDQTCEEFFGHIMAGGVSVLVGEIDGVDSTANLELLEKRLANAGLLGYVTIGITADETNPEVLYANFYPRID